MRIPAYVTLAAITVALVIGWQDHRHLTAARQDLARLVRETSGSSAASSVAGSQDVRRTREDSREAAALLASEWMDHLQQLEAMQQQQPPGEPDAAMQEREGEFWDRSHLLTVAGWESFISRVLDTTGVPDTVRRDLINHAISTLAKMDPHSALTMIARISALFDGDRRVTELMDLTIYQLAKQDPVAAADRVRHPGEALAALVSDQTKISLIIGTSSKDPSLAFRMLDEFDFKDRNQAIWSLGESARTPEQKTAILKALRERLPDLTDTNARAMMSKTILKGLANTFAYGNFGEAKKWFESASLTPAELANCAEQLQGSVLRPETGLWIEWLGNKLPPEDSSRITADMMNSWTKNDHQAAATWLSAAADGPVKNSAIAGYVTAVAEYEPEIAARWAITLPDGKERTESLQWVHQNWPEEEAAARDAFAKEHGFTWP
ncbi:MAG: hypothetical protein EOP83_18515 [Verrucomicrobiaceae bacterium]|nr:MAG: hypothetical protein EOP83_18515 [Verrucomicrobiaceae bacterium]